MDCRVDTRGVAVTGGRRPSGRSFDWLRAVEEVRPQAGQLMDFADEVREEGLVHVVLLGMGGSILAAEVMAFAFGPAEGFPELIVLDTTDAQAIAAVEARIDLARTLFVIADRDGETVETASLHSYFLARLRELAGDVAGRQFVAITHEGSPLEWRVHEERMRAMFLDDEEVPDGYSALSYFGVVPAALIGIDLDKLLERAEAATAAWYPAEGVDNPAVELGVAVAELARAGRDKLTIVASPRVGNIGSWIEGLVAASTGKDGTGIFPVDVEPLLGPEAYGDDRQMLYVRLDDAPDAGQDEALARLEQAGVPVHRVSLRDRYDLGALFVLWEVAAVTAAYVLGVDPFAHPDEAEAEYESLQALVELEDLGGLTADAAGGEAAGTTGGPAGGEVSPARGASEGGAPREATGDGPIVFRLDDARLEPALRELAGSLAPPDYVALQAWLTPGSDTWLELQAIREALLRRRRVATSEGFAPRLLQITGQLHKGGPREGVCLQLVSDGGPELEVPGADYTFTRLKRAQSLGDLQALRDRGRRVMRVELGDDPVAGLKSFREVLERALAA